MFSQWYSWGKTIYLGVQRYSLTHLPTFYQSFWRMIFKTFLINLRLLVLLVIRICLFYLHNVHVSGVFSVAIYVTVLQFMSCHWQQMLLFFCWNLCLFLLFLKSEIYIYIYIYIFKIYHNSLPKKWKMFDPLEDNYS